MDHSKAIRLATVAVAAAVLRGQTADPANVLERARDRYLAANREMSRQVCVETIDRSYFRRADPIGGRLSCERLYEDRKRPRFRLSLDATDRLRVRVALVGGREIYSWTAPGTFSANVEEILDSGSMGTGAFRTFLLDIFSNPAVRFRLVDEKATELEFGYRVPLEASHYYARAGREWPATSYDGSISIDPDSAGLRSMVAETSELPPQSSMCEVNTVLEFEPQRGDGPVPRAAKAHEIMVDGTERDRVTTFSGCGEPDIPKETVAGPPVLPAGLPVILALERPIDWQTDAAGDVISATVTKPVIQPHSGRILLREGAVVTGRILELIHQVKSPAGFFATIGFDTLESDGVRSRFYATGVSGQRTGTSMDRDKPSDPWPEGTFAFLSRKSEYVLPAGFVSKWITVAR